MLNGVFWTLGIEIQFYLLAPLLVLPMLKSTGMQRIVTVIGIYLATLSIVHYAVTHLGWAYDGRNVISNLPHFFVGMAACQLLAGGKPDVMRFRYSLASALVLLGYVNWLYNRHPERFWSMQGIVFVDLLILLLVIAHVSLGSERTNDNYYYRVLALLGTLSYGIYAWHGYLMKIVLITPILTPVLLLASIALAYLSYKFIEFPMLRRKRLHT